MNVLALDVATKCGWATGKDVYGLWDLSVKKDESKGMRLIRFKAKLKEVCEAIDINLVVFERVAGFNTGALLSEAELIGVLKVFCEENEIEYRAYSAKEIKLFGAGKGTANKQAMISAAKKKYNYSGNDDNEADALHLYHLAIQDLKLF